MIMKIKSVEENEIKYREEQKRTLKRKKQPDETAESEHTFTAQEKFKIPIFLIIRDNLITQIEKRSDAYQRVHGEFFLFALTTRMKILN